MDKLTPPVITGNAWPGVRYFSTTRAGGVSLGPYASLNLGAHTGDDPGHVQENRCRLRARLPADPYWLRQVHGIAVADADAAGLHYCARAPQADAAITSRIHCVLTVLTADCLPVVLGDALGRVLGIAHAGWRGLAHGVLEQTLLRLRQRCPQARDWRAWIGPCIGPRAFVVGRDVFDAFVAPRPHAAAHFQATVSETCASETWFADLPGLATMLLRAAGVDQVQWCGQCTFSNPAQYFSYRYRAVTGRMASCAWRVDA